MRTRASNPGGAWLPSPLAGVDGPDREIVALVVRLVYRGFSDRRVIYIIQRVDYPIGVMSLDKLQGLILILNDSLSEASEIY